VKPNILFLEEVHEVLEQRLSAVGYHCLHDYNCDAGELSERYSTIYGIVLRSRMVMTRSIMESLPDLRFIARSGSGLENIDLTAASELQIEVFSSPEGNRDAVAEHVIGMLLTIMNRLHLANNDVKSGAWNRELHRGNELRGKTVGIIGYGHMGSALAHKLTGFGVKVIALDKYKIVSALEPVLQVDEEVLFTESDIISLHLPLSKETYGYADDIFFRKFQKPIYFVNTARGKHLKTSSLLNALHSGKVLGACLDVLEFESRTLEGLNVDSDVLSLLKADNRVLLTPHVAGWTSESYYKLSNVLADKILNKFGTIDSV
jgi:D-3-phosphoglycerate dehydrogenase